VLIDYLAILGGFDFTVKSNVEILSVLNQNQPQKRADFDENI